MLDLDDVDSEKWHELALCAQTDPEMFFPEKGASATNAKKICGACPVRAQALGGTGECLEFALHNDERFGIWGGYSERERRGMKPSEPRKRKQRQLAAHGTEARARKHLRDGEKVCQECAAASAAANLERAQARRAKQAQAN